MMVKGMFAPLALLAFALVFFGCGRSEEDKIVKDLDKAIARIEERHDAVMRTLNEQKAVKDQLEANLEKVKTQGMRDKLEKEIFMKELTISNFEKDLANQEDILSQLIKKRDSLMEVKRK